MCDTESVFEFDFMPRQRNFAAALEYIYRGQPENGGKAARARRVAIDFFGNDYAITAAEGVFTICFGGEERVKRNEEEGKRRHTAGTRVHHVYTRTYIHTHARVRVYVCTCIYI